MILKNFIPWSQNLYLTVFSGGINGAVNLGGNITTMPNNSDTHYINATYGRYVDVGFSTTVPTIDDYKLADSNAIDTPTLTFINSNETGIYPSIRTVTSLYRNDTNSDVIVTEIGIATKGNGANNSDINALLTRTVLSTPVTVHVGETMAFTESIELVD